MYNMKIEELNYLEKLLKEKNCPGDEITPLAMQIINQCRKENISVYNIELNKTK